MITLAQMKRNITLDFLRICACFMVIFYHYFFYGPKLGKTYSGFSYDYIFSYGYLGIDVFFIISGFVIYNSLRTRDVWGFFKARVMRLYPTYWICLSISIIGICFLSDSALTSRQILINFSMLQSFFNVKSIDGVYWTLAIEIIFYVLISLCFFLFKGKIFTALVSFWLFCSFLSLMGYFDFGFFESVFLLKWIPYFAFGLCISFLNINDKRSKIFILLSFASFTLLIYRTYIRSENLAHSNDFNINPLYAALILTFIIAFFIKFLNFETSRGMIENIIITLAAGTYPLYLLHQEIGYAVFSKFAFMDNFIGKVIFIIFLIAVSCACIPRLEFSLRKELVKLVRGYEKYNFYKQS
uniref:Acyltransferase 3 domain-containing protein n=1 Tax=Vibrio parahaemolyticus TaxID=670 RepID=A0A7M1VLZ8_VIBPH|nr:hypothetical protein VP356_00029 [Vibrio parahaemolyticus]